MFLNKLVKGHVGYRGLKVIRKCLSAECVRKQRTFDELEHWKATEFRMFLMCNGMVVFHGIVKKEYYDHFVILVCGIRTLCD